MKQNMSSLGSPDPDVRLKVEPAPVRPFFTMQKTTEELYNVARRVAREGNLKLGYGQFGDGSDDNFADALGIPTLDDLGVCGNGVHTMRRHLLVSSLAPRARLFAGLLEALSDRNK